VERGRQHTGKDRKTRGTRLKRQTEDREKRRTWMGGKTDRLYSGPDIREV
jgi:hypothetical protein